MFAQWEGGNGEDGMDWVGGRYGARIDMLVLFIQHFPVILIIFCRREFFTAVDGPPVIHIAENGEFSFAATIYIADIRLSFAAGPYPGYDQFIPGSYKTFGSQDMTGNGIKARCSP